MNVVSSAVPQHWRAGLVTLLAAALLVAVGGTPAAAQDEGEGEPARGDVTIEGQPLTEPETPNEVKVGCDFRVDFFGFEEQTVPVEFSLQPPSGESELTTLEAQLEEAQGNELSGSLDVDLTDDLSDVQPADAEDFNYKVRVDVIVKDPGEGEEVTKSAMLFIECPAAAGDDEVAGGEEGAADDEAEEQQTPAGGVDAGLGGAAGGAPWLPLFAVLGIGIALGGALRWGARGP